MKGRESGMPEEECWGSFFDAQRLVDILVPGLEGGGDLVEFGSGYGTFTIPAAAKTAGTVYGFDIEPALVSLVDEKCRQLGIHNVRLETRDFVEYGTGLTEGSVQHVMIYNILHIENPVALLTEAFRILRPGGSASVIHWRSDMPTPRGPSLDIRPLPEQCAVWAKRAGFQRVEKKDISSAAQYHYGMIFHRNEPYYEGANKSTMAKPAEWVVDSNKVLTLTGIFAQWRRMWMDCGKPISYQLQS